MRTGLEKMATFDANPDETVLRVLERFKSAACMFCSGSQLQQRE